MRVALMVLGVCAGVSGRGVAQITQQAVDAYLWPESPAAFRRAQLAIIAADSALGHLSRDRLNQLVSLMRRGPVRLSPARPPLAPDSIDRIAVATPAGTIPVYVRAPRRYTPDSQWPLILAMHGGPPGSEAAATRGALRMIQVWAEVADRAGWIVAAPAMVSVVARDGRTPNRLPYEILHPEEAQAVVHTVRRRYRITPDRIVSTGISLGSNFSIGFAAAHPDWFSAIVPVSTEGESREHLLRNLAAVPVYVLGGAQDRNIRGVSGPRALHRILAAFGADITYREFADRAHEGFQEHYDDVLRWLESRSRTVPPRVLRVPHPGIVPVARRVHWIASSTRQGVVRATVTQENRIELDARWTGAVTVYLNDDLVDLDRPVEIVVNGTPAFAGDVRRSFLAAVEDARQRGDQHPVYPARVTVSVPATAASVERGVALWDALRPRHDEGPLSYWEMYAVRALEERFPSVGFEGHEVELPGGVAVSAPEQVAVRVTAVDPAGTAGRAGLRVGDVILRVGGDPFFRDRGDVATLHHWMVRELRSTPAPFDFVVVRGGRRLTLKATYRLGPYRPPGR